MLHCSTLHCDSRCWAERYSAAFFMLNTDAPLQCSITEQAHGGKCWCWKLPWMLSIRMLVSQCMIWTAAWALLLLRSHSRSA